MNPRTKQELDEIIYELNAITKELDDLSEGMAREFKGIGTLECSKGIKTLSGKYTKVKNQLYEIK
ncbi:hypothetical protein SAMN05444401_2596 [Clostridium amylolyticum]|uniref:Uncharacterized protein n=1 Tax=Clostridium amylolyticum TaxID=1121298 RepID=A0A1M6I252_9CLOT|nr:hypothetical protein [Clostridium amylolyticum]SHJ28334.1 hypothetical protein SAMN05444401_2596 [Clostridium amylolyticum]